MKFLKQHANSIILCLFEILVGILLLIDPLKFTSNIITVFGVVLMLVGLLCIIRYFRTDAIEAAANQSLVKGLIALASGLFCVFKTEWFIITFPLLTILYGVGILIAGLVKIQWAIDLIRLKSGRWFLPAISAAISIICSLVILQNPFASTVILWIFTGASLVVEAIFDVFSLIFIENRANKQ